MMRRLMLVLIFSINFPSVGSGVQAAPTKTEDVTTPFDSGLFVDEVISASENKRVFDLRNIDLELSLGYNFVSDGTVYDSSGGYIGLGFPVGSGAMIRTGVRKIKVYANDAGRDLEKTPLRQPAQSNRYEIFGLFGYSLIEGRSFSRLSSWIADLEHAFSLEGGMRYAHPTVRWIPGMKHEAERLPGQRVDNAKFGAELGLRYQVFLPSGFGLEMAAHKILPFGKSDVPIGDWNLFTLGVCFAFGGVDP